MKSSDWNRIIDFSYQIDGVGGYKVIALYRHHSFILLTGNSTKTHPDTVHYDEKNGVTYSTSHAESVMLRRLDKNKQYNGTLFVVRLRQHANGDLAFGCSKPCKFCAPRLLERRIKTVFMNEERKWETLF